MGSPHEFPSPSPQSVLVLFLWPLELVWAMGPQSIPGHAEGPHRTLVDYDGREGVAKDGMEGVEASPSKDDLSDLVSLKAGTHQEYAECGMEILQWSS